MIRILSENKESEIEVSGNAGECMNEVLNIIPNVIIDIATQTAISEGEEETALDRALDLLAASAGVTIHKLIGGDIKGHIGSMTGSIKDYIALAKNKDKIEEVLFDMLGIKPEEVEKPEADEPAQEETAETEAEKE